MPEVMAFSLDLNSRTVSLTFDETIDSGTFVITSVGLQDSGSDPFQFVQLSSRSSTTSEDGTVFVINLSDDDFNEITAVFPLATMESNTYLVLAAGAVLDTAGNPSMEVPSSNALVITNHTADTISPSLDSFEFDLDMGILTLVFSESVNASTFDVMQVTLQNSQASPTHFHTLTGGLVSQMESTTIDVDLSRADLNEIKGITGLCSSASNTYVSITSATVQDMNGNPVLPVPMSVALSVGSGFTADVTGPILESFDLNMDSGLLSLYFDEVVDTSSLLTTALTLSPSSGSDGSSSHQLVSSAGTNPGDLSDTVHLQIGDFDLNEMKKLRICISNSTCLLYASTSLIMDVPHVAIRD